MQGKFNKQELGDISEEFALAIHSTCPAEVDTEAVLSELQSLFEICCAGKFDQTSGPNPKLLEPRTQFFRSQKDDDDEQPRLLQ